MARPESNNGRSPRRRRGGKRTALMNGIGISSRSQNSLTTPTHPPIHPRTHTHTHTHTHTNHPGHGAPGEQQRPLSPEATWRETYRVDERDWAEMFLAETGTDGQLLSNKWYVAYRCLCLCDPPPPPSPLAGVFVRRPRGWGGAVRGDFRVMVD